MKLLVLSAILITTPAAACDYAVVPEKSVLRFIAEYEGESFEGGFGRFTATVSVDAANTANTRITADIDVASANTENEERDQTLATAEFFDTARFPKAAFRTLACRASNFKLKWFGLFSIPALWGPDKELKHLAEDVHEWLSWAIVTLVVLHVAGALKHHFVDRDDVLRRMLPGRRAAPPPVANPEIAP